jgi:hypothetical protein
MSTGLYRQLQLADVDDTDGKHASPPIPVYRRVELSLVAPPEPAAAPAWDPHDVWLNRVKKPRDARGG